MTRIAFALASALVAILFAGCVDPLEEPVVESGEIAIGETRRYELRFLRFDVENYEQTLTREDLLELPQATQERLWLLDLDVSNSPGSPRLIDNALEEIRDLDPEALDQPSVNMQLLLNTTPDTTNLDGTSFEALVELSPVLGVSPARVLADLVQINIEDRFFDSEVIAGTILSNVIATHPNAQFRLGPVTNENPEGLYPVSPGAIPITLADAASDFATLADRFGPVYVEGVYHPGFISGDTRSAILTDEFAMTVRANANALPYKGLDLSEGSKASVNSISSQIQTLFNFDDPDWLIVEGLVEGVPTIEKLTFQIVEDDAFHLGGRSPLPRPFGDSTAWRLPPWTIERIVLDSALAGYETLDSEVTYYLPGDERPAFSLVVEDGWTEVETAGGLGSPPAPSYVWDLLLEVAQVRLHDGGVPEGEGNAAFTLRDVPVGIDTRTIEDTIRDNLESDPFALTDIAEQLIDTTEGAADFYYYRVGDDGREDERGDWLFFVAPTDIPEGDDGNPVRPFQYPNVGFFADEALSERVSSFASVDGDTAHEKIRIEEGDTFFMQDDEGQVFRIDVLEKPGRSTIALDVTRVR